MGVDHDSMGVDHNSVGVDHNSVGADHNSVGFDHNSVGFDYSVRVDPHTIIVDLLTFDLKGSKNVAGDSRHIQLKEDLDKVLLTFKKNASKIYLENAKLELKQAEEKLRRTIFDLLMELAMGANLYICMNYNVEHEVAAMTIAGQSV